MANGKRKTENGKRKTLLKADASKGGNLELSGCSTYYRKFTFQMQLIVSISIRNYLFFLRKTENGKRYYSGVTVDEPKMKELEDALKEQETSHYVLRLYVAGLNRISLRAIENLKKICEENLQERYELRT
jgi:hypothetical protein